MMNDFIQALQGALSFDCTKPNPKVLVVKSRGQGRRLLQWLAQTVTLVNVSVETPRSLAIDLCAKALSQPNGPKALSQPLSIHCLAETLEQVDTGYYGNRPTAKTPEAAKLFYTTFQELSMGKIQESQLTGMEKLESICALWQAYGQAKGRFLDEADVMALAVEQARQSKAYGKTSFYVLEGSGFAPLELELLSAVSDGKVETISMPKPQMGQLSCRFVSCRGMETEVRFLFEDLLRKGKSLEQCAVVYLDNTYATAIANTAYRWNVPVTMASGLPLKQSKLFYLLTELAQWPKANHRLDILHEVLSSGGCGPERYNQLADVLARNGSLHGISSYQLTDDKKPDQLDDEIWSQWKEFLNLATTLADNTVDKGKQVVNLRRFLSHFTAHHTSLDVAAYSAAQGLMDTAVETCGQDTALLQQLLDLMEESNYMPAPTGAPSLLCMTLSQGLLSGRTTLYVVGMGRYALDDNQGESPILLDDERVKLGNMETVTSRGETRRRLIEHLIATHRGDLIFSYSNFSSGDIIEGFLPAPYFEQVRQEVQGTVEEVSYIPAEPMTPAEISLCNPDYAPEIPLPIATGDGGKSVDFGALIADFRFSASSLEVAYACPLKFYLSRILGIYPPALALPKNTWLEGRVLGDAMHHILDDYFTLLLQTPHVDVNPLIQKACDRLTASYPCFDPATEELRRVELEELENMVKTAIAKYQASGRTVQDTEAAFGEKKDEPLAMSIKDRTLLLSGSIDRVDYDEKQETYHIVDYKSTKPNNFHNDEAKHLQHYLYARAYEILHPDRKVTSFNYQLLRDAGNYVAYDQSPVYRQVMEAKLDGLLEFLSHEENIKTPCPCFVLDGNGELNVGGDETRLKARTSCSYNCDFVELCRPTWKEMSK